MKPISVYVHIPFCTVKCGYCDFNAYAGMDTLKPAYLQALLNEIAGYRDLLRDRTVVSIGFGGGTPGEVPTSHIAQVIDAIATTAHVEPGAEITLEANPGSVTPRTLPELRAAGVTRLSLGAQTFDADRLAFLDRIHSVAAIGASFRAARAAGFESISLDLIYGIPGQGLEGATADLDAALALEPDHVSLYALTVEEGTPLYWRVQDGRVVMPPTDEVADIYESAAERLAHAGFHHYELSNWAQPGHESRHNLGYWTARDYLGVGAGAHGFVDGARYENIAHPRSYIEVLPGGAEPGDAVADRYTPPQAMAVSDWLTLRLRLVDGFHEAAFEAAFGFSLESCLGPLLEDLVSAGVLQRDGGRISLSRRGHLLHSEVAVRIVDYLERTGLPDPAPAT